MEIFINALFHSIETLDVVWVSELLKNGADPNVVHEAYSNFPNWDDQPYTPLRLVVFYLSDAMLEKEDYRKLLEITKLLLHYGADTKPAIELAERRYGKFDFDIQTPADLVLQQIYQPR